MKKFLNTVIAISCILIVLIIVLTVLNPYKTSDEAKNSESEVELDQLKKEHNIDETKEEITTINGEVEQADQTSETENKIPEVKDTEEILQSIEEEIEVSLPTVKERGETESNSDQIQEEPNTGGLHFSSREEAIQFGLSRFTTEEISIYNRVAAKGLTPQQEEMAIQMAYSRFTAEEIAAIEEALGK